MKYQTMIDEILSNVGGKGNVNSVAHCMTRLRFNLKDDSKANIDAMKSVKGVLGCVNKGGQLQVIIGPSVTDVYNELLEYTGIEAGGSVDVQEDDKADTAPAKKKNFFDWLCDLMSGVIMPIIGPLAGTGMVKAVLAIAVQFGWITKDSQTYTIFYMAADCLFYYMPIFLAYSAGKKFKVNPFLSMVLAAMLVHPTYMGLKSAGEPVHLFGVLPVTLASYTSSVVPILLIVWFQSIIEHFMEKHTPKAIRVFFVPMVVLLITIPVAFVVLGPLGSIIGGYIAGFFTWLDAHASWIVPTLVGFVFPFLVMTGMHIAVSTAQSVQRASVGYATILSPGMMVSNMATSAASFGVALKTKNKELKTLAASTGVTALMGITEPALYGINMEYKTPLYATMLGGLVGGFYAGIMKCKQWSYASSNIFGVAVYLGEDNSFLHICIAVALSMATAFVASYLMFKDDAKKEKVLDA
ncbi:MAG: PTS transporter subunit EIIC [Bulleidia sp.]|nr:PTS transporter subunit EIIC [Bulleidia sp.]